MEIRLRLGPYWTKRLTDKDLGTKLSQRLNDQSTWGKGRWGTNNTLNRGEDKVCGTDLLPRNKVSSGVMDIYCVVAFKRSGIRITREDWGSGKGTQILEIWDMGQKSSCTANIRGWPERMMMPWLGPADVGLGPDSGTGLNIQKRQRNPAVMVKEMKHRGQRPRYLHVPIHFRIQMPMCGNLYEVVHKD